MDNVINIYKPKTFTPLELIHLVKKNFIEYKDAKMAYAGRLDPMAHGVTILLVNDQCKQRDLYQNFDKIYKFQLLLGINTDTHDVLGIIDGINLNYNIQEIIKKCYQIKQNYVGKIVQKLPVYSSQPVNGKPLFWWANQGKLDQITIPTKTVEIKNLEIISCKEYPLKALVDNIIIDISRVNGQFRQNEIINKWQTLSANYSDNKVLIVEMEAQVTTGTYIRSLAHQIGIDLGIGALAYDILRIRVGDYTLEQSIKIDL
jgi:tRNA pseudouridine55 synthase